MSHVQSSDAWPNPHRNTSARTDRLYQCHQWQANLRILDVEEIKTVPYAPLSHPFVERLIGTIRRECLDRTLFWRAADLEMKLLEFQRCFNGHRVCAAPAGGACEVATCRPIEGGRVLASRVNLRRIRMVSSFGRSRVHAAHD
jgi:hypothetical protein